MINNLSISDPQCREGRRANNTCRQLQLPTSSAQHQKHLTLETSAGDTLKPSPASWIIRATLAAVDLLKNISPELVQTRLIKTQFSAAKILSTWKTLQDLSLGDSIDPPQD